MSKSRITNSYGRQVHLTSRGDALRRLAGWVSISLVLAVAATWATASAGLLRVGWFFFAVVPAIGVVLWAAIEGMGESAVSTWHRHTFDGSGQAEFDASTCRLADNITRATHGSAAGISRVADELAAAIQPRLIVHHGADPADPWATAHVLSPGLVNFLASAHTEQPQAISPAILSTYLREIEQL